MRAARGECPQSQNQGGRRPPTGPQSHAADRDRGCASLRPAAALAPSATAAERTARNPKRRYLHTSADISYGRKRRIGVATGAEALREGWAKRRSTGD
jgi:hypothetical protein